MHSTNSLLILVFSTVVAAVAAAVADSRCETGELKVPHDSPLRIGYGPYSYDYTAPNGPPNWGSINCPGYDTCRKGKLQSPFDLDFRSVDVNHKCRLSLNIVESKGSIMKWKPVPQDFKMDCVDRDGCGTMEYRGVKYNFLQLHTHSYNEYTLDGLHAPIAFHLVHGSDDGRFAVLGVLVVEGAPNPAFESILDAAHARGQGLVNVSRLIGDVAVDPRPCTFKGSLTTPPCTEGIQWILSRTTVTVSRRQIQRYQAMTGNVHNNRPVQSRNARPIMCYDVHLPDNAPTCPEHGDPVVPTKVQEERQRIFEERLRIREERKRIEASRPMM